MINALNNFLPTGAERVLMAGGSIVGGALSFAFGDVGPLLVWLLVFTVTDFFLGTVVAIIKGEWSPHRNFLGVTKKFLMFVIVALSHGLDDVFQPVIHAQIFQSITICAYAAGEFGSILKTLERAGLGGVVPPVLRSLINSINERIEEKAKAELVARGLTEKKEKGK